MSERTNEGMKAMETEPRSPALPEATDAPMVEERPTHPSHPTPPTPPTPPTVPMATLPLPAPIRPTPSAPLSPAPSATPRPLLGPALRIYGALLWAYVVFGQFTTSWIDDRPLGEGWALLGVLATTATVAVLAVRTSVHVAPTTALGIVRRTAAAVAIALLAWFSTVAGLTVTRALNGDLKNAAALVFVALVASVVGLRMNRDPARDAAMHGRRVVQVMIWVTLSVVTLVAGAELVAVG